MKNFFQDFEISIDEFAIARMYRAFAKAVMRLPP
jgi:hypothetical protein